MRFSQDPIHISPRMLPRRWGRAAAPAWCATAPRPDAPIGEIWLAHPNNVAEPGRHIGALVADAPAAMLGELGRAPPSVRLVLTDEPSDAVRAEGQPSLWSMLESPLDNVITAKEVDDLAPRRIRARRGDLIRTEPGAVLHFGAGLTALEVRSNFSPTNSANPLRVQRIARPADRVDRATWLRDPALSVEAWTLPELSVLEPDGETCHVFVALSPGAYVDGRALNRGDAFLLPAEGRRVMLAGRGAQIMAAYPDLAPTSIWKRLRPPSPAAMAIDPALSQRFHVSALSEAPVTRAAA